MISLAWVFKWRMKPFFQKFLLKKEEERAAARARARAAAPGRIYFDVYGEDY